MLTPFDKQRRLDKSPCNGRKGKAAEEIQGSKVGIEAYGDNFWDSEGVLLIDYCQRDYYEWPILREFKQAQRDSRTEATWEVIAQVLFYETMHLSTRISRQALKDTGLSEIDHHSPDLAPSDYFHQFKRLRGRRFVDDNQMKMAVESHLKEYF
ncbi:hypothetical protein EVAR_16141_1 [Eumeta japonica]|uniref:Mariner Mos1 transposase n=1 Tax=Eumeta variegata TaxID=151549 RepID=A0A4C1WDD4_EUMVA|nr:hypothetical protein EVAR_16141_1 [Eumeta japonica]